LIEKKEKKKMGNVPDLCLDQEWQKDTEEWQIKEGVLSRNYK
jgi:hypothetical protein